MITIELGSIIKSSCQPIPPRALETVNLTLLAFLVIIFVIIVFKRFKKIVQEQYWSTDDFKNVKEMYKKHNENVKKFLEKDKEKKLIKN